MIDISSKNIVIVSKETNFIKDNLEKVFRLINILEIIYTSKFKDKLVLKGETAINLLYMNVPRLSVDIDLDYIGQSKEEMLLDRMELKNYINSLLSCHNYVLSKNTKSSYALDSFVLQYRNNAGNLDNIKIEVNYLNRIHILPLETKLILLFNYQSNVKILTLNKYELYASKISALLDRSKPRDIYDVLLMI